jgi:hypothetical protein
MNVTTKKQGLKGQHPFMDINNPKVKLEEGEDLFLCVQFLESMCTQPCCDRISGHKRNQRCSCLCILIGSDARQMAAAKYMVAFANNPQQERHSIIMEWLRYMPSKCNQRCSCLCILIGSDARQMAAAKYMVAFANNPQQERHSIIMEWLRYMPSIFLKKNHCCFFIPFVASDVGR